MHARYDALCIQTATGLYVGDGRPAPQCVSSGVADSMEQLGTVRAVDRLHGAHVLAYEMSRLFVFKVRYAGGG